ncbi:hypothetical protein [Candidatus Sororendozoicomonas aggregata]|uniref:hypothetical protein n=1 Tax=Candidatus Sororendozoicomonas aggregata TaxID=3073239 RepID=UPI002ED4152B
MNLPIFCFMLLIANLSLAGDNQYGNYLTLTAEYLKQTISNSHKLPPSDIQVTLSSFNRDHHSSEYDGDTTVDGYIDLNITASKSGAQTYQWVCDAISDFLAEGCTIFYPGKANLLKGKGSYVTSYHSFDESSSSSDSSDESSSSSESHSEIEKSTSNHWKVSVKKKNDLKKTNLRLEYSGIIIDKNSFDLYSNESDQSSSCPMDKLLENHFQRLQELNQLVK